MFFFQQKTYTSERVPDKTSVSPGPPNSATEPARGDAKPVLPYRRYQAATQRNLLVSVSEICNCDTMHSFFFIYLKKKKSSIGILWFAFYPLHWELMTAESINVSPKHGAILTQEEGSVEFKNTPSKNKPASPVLPLCSAVERREARAVLSRKVTPNLAEWVPKFEVHSMSGILMLDKPGATKPYPTQHQQRLEHAQGCQPTNSQ